MTRASKLALPILLLVGASCCFASEESPLVFSSFSIEATNGLRSVRLQGRGGDNEIIELGIHAFGKYYELTRQQIDRLSAVKINGVQISSDGGFSNDGGEKIIVMLSTGYVAGVVDKKYILISELGNLEVLDSIE